MLNRIEEVKKILKEVWKSGRDYSQVFDFQECLIREKWDERLFPQPIDKKLREKALLADEEIAEVLRRTPYTAMKFESKLTAQDSKAFKDEMRIELRAVANATTDKALALLQLKIEEARRQERMELGKWLESRLFKYYADYCPATKQVEEYMELVVMTKEVKSLKEGQALKEK